MNCSKIKVVSTNFQTCLHSRGGSRKFRKSWCEAVVCHFHPSNNLVQVLFGKKVSKKASTLLSVPFELAFTSFKILFFSSYTGKQLSKKTVKSTRTIGSVRIHIERAIGRLKDSTRELPSSNATHCRQYS